MGAAPTSDEHLLADHSLRIGRSFEEDTDGLDVTCRKGYQLIGEQVNGRVEGGRVTVEARRFGQRHHGHVVVERVLAEVRMRHGPGHGDLLQTLLLLADDVLAETHRHPGTIGGLVSRVPNVRSHRLGEHELTYSRVSLGKER